jgi:hypothetical protein
MAKVIVRGLVGDEPMATYSEDDGHFALSAISQVSREHALLGLGYTLANNGIEFFSAQDVDKVEIEVQEQSNK